MIERAIAVIGSNWGDEGKGLLTDYYVRQFQREQQTARPVLVVRHNGGSQAGHTVCTDTRRHIFKHIGSGALAGAQTLLSRDFICNPSIFARELTALENAGMRARLPSIFVDGRCRVTTPYDMLINRALERSRGAQRHGSVGFGINETVTRYEHAKAHWLTANLFEWYTASRQQRLSMLKATLATWVTYRLNSLSLSLTVEESELMYSELLREHWVDDFETFASRVIIESDIVVLQRAESVVFEGAQGLRLDEHSPDFPYVTRSRTGATNAVRLASEAGVSTLDLCYVTRAYATRHGAGPLPYDCGSTPMYSTIVDETNVPNGPQGTLRFAPLDVNGTAITIRADHAAHITTDGPTLRPQLAVTCLDQLPEEFVWVGDGAATIRGNKDAFLDAVTTSNPYLFQLLVSAGPTARHVSVYQQNTRRSYPLVNPAYDAMMLSSYA